ncbi:hypothetical protein FHT02_004044 [Sphingomonas xinjiangensis]|uniref:Uncharacterized protein n=1 Tax=Sphingomonas xinjiangensis TaxID=643568 RepID=A0A840YT20_9SPHN|nr:hypothetical protein [Sphingomonas xinjiangensis]
MHDAATREMIAYGLIGLILILVLTGGGIGWQRHRRTKLRRRGIKRHGH